MKNLNAKNLSLLNTKTTVPNYNRSTIETSIVHVGVGGFHRSHQAYLLNKLIKSNNKETQWGICGVALLEFDIKIYNILKTQDCLYTLITKGSDGSVNTEIIGSIVQLMFAPNNPLAVIEKMAHVNTKIISLTITEGGYNYNENTHLFNVENPLIQNDLKNSKSPLSIFGYLTQALLLRKTENRGGLTILSCDNIQENGTMTKNMLLSFIKLAEPNLIPWINENVSFPNCMVDRITPVTSKEDINYVQNTLEINDQWPVVCEPFIQWVIEDNFIAGRPKWENVGVQFVDNVEPYEKMKLHLLNAGHSVLGILGALIDYNTIDEVVKNENIKQFLINFMNIEVTPTLGELEGFNLENYKKTLIERFSNKNIKDQISRICSESSSKLPKFLIPTIKDQINSENNFVFSSFLIAAWNIYSLGYSETNKPLNRIDKMKDKLKQKAQESKTKDPLKFLEIKSIFGELINNKKFTDLYTKAYSEISELGIEKCIEKINNDTKTKINNI